MIENVLEDALVEKEYIIQEDLEIIKQINDESYTYSNKIKVECIPDYGDSIYVYVPNNYPSTWTQEENLEMAFSYCILFGRIKRFSYNKGILIIQFSDYYYSININEYNPGVDDELVVKKYITDKSFESAFPDNDDYNWRSVFYESEYMSTQEMYSQKLDSVSQENQTKLFLNVIYEEC